MEPNFVNQVVTNYIQASPAAQLAILVASKRSSIYTPDSQNEIEALDSYWKSDAVLHDFGNSLFSGRIPLPPQDVLSYTINPNLSAYLRLLFTGTNYEELRNGDYFIYGSDELKQAIAAAVEDGSREFEVEGILKLEALGYSIANGTINPSGPVEINGDNPLEGTLKMKIEDSFPA